MRKLLAKSLDERKRFTARFVRIGKKAGFRGYSEETILLADVTDATTGERVTDHIWFGFTKGFQDAGLSEGATVEFDARVTQYKKGYVNKAAKIDNQRKDFKLSHPTRIIRGVPVKK